MEFLHKVERENLNLPEVGWDSCSWHYVLVARG